jgi:hypothetical protein
MTTGEKFFWGSVAVVGAAPVAIEALGVVLGHGVVDSAGTVMGYVGIDGAGVIRYVGISKDLAVRWGQHLTSGTQNASLQFQAVTGASFSSRLDARIWEQTQINLYKLSKDGGQLWNKRNEIARKFWDALGIK